MSNRLDSLSSKTKPALKFKPKAVARKSKEDREKDARVIKTEEAPRATRGRGGARGGRGRGGALAGTHMVMAGPLSMGSVALRELRQNKMHRPHGKFNASDEQSSTTVLAKMMSRVRGDDSAKHDSDDEDHKAGRIDMGKEYACARDEALLFPVRPDRDSEAGIDSMAIASEPVLVVLSAAASRVQTADSLKSEATDSVAPESPPVVDVASDCTRAEQDRLIDDQRSILDFVTLRLGAHKIKDMGDRAASDASLIMFQMPQILPAQCDSVSECNSPFSSNTTQTFSGQVGSLNFHYSGKISIRMNNGSVYECYKGATPSFLQEVYAVDSLSARKTAEELDSGSEVKNTDNVKVAGEIHRLGEVVGKIVAKPSLL